MSKFRILCLRSDRIGDMLVSTPVIHRVRTLYPDAVLDVIVSPLGAVALEGNPDVDHVFVYDKKSVRTWFSLLPRLLEPHDFVVSFNAKSKTLRMLTLLARGRRKGALNTGRLAPGSGSPEDGEHYSGVMLRELEAAFDLPHDEHPDISIRFALPEKVEAAVRATYPPAPGLRRVGIFIGNIKKTGLRWPIEKFVELTRVLLEKNDAASVHRAEVSAAYGGFSEDLQRLCHLHLLAAASGGRNEGSHGFHHLSVVGNALDASRAAEFFRRFQGE